MPRPYNLSRDWPDSTRYSAVCMWAWFTSIDRCAGARMFEGVAKLCQRQIYSWLSSKCGLPICIIGLLVAVISAFQFGEVSLSFYLMHTTLKYPADNASVVQHMAPEIWTSVRA